MTDNEIEKIIIKVLQDDGNLYEDIDHQYITDVAIERVRKEWMTMHGPAGKRGAKLLKIAEEIVYD